MISQIAVIGLSSPSGRVILFGDVYSAITGPSRPVRRLRNPLASGPRSPQDHAAENTRAERRPR